MGALTSTSDKAPKPMNPETSSTESVPTESPDKGTTSEDLLQRLPLEIQLQIFSNFEPHDLTGNVAPVCKRWWRLSQDPSLWRDLCLHLHSEKLKEASVTILTRCTSMRNLRIRSQFPLTAVIRFLKTFPNLQTLDMSFCHIDAHILAAIVTTCRNIDNLDLHCCKVDLDCVNQIVTLPKLQSLKLHMCRHLDDDCVKTIARRCKNLNVLTIASIRKVITDEAICEVITNHGKTLRHLDLRGLNLTDVSVCAVAKCHNLSSFMLTYGMRLTDKSLNALEELRNLKTLEISGTNVSRAAVRSFFTRPCMERVENLSIYHMNIDDELLQSLNGRWNNMTKLTFCGCREITSVGMKRLVRECRKLRSLLVDSMPDLTGEFLEDVPEFLPNLTKLVIIDCLEVSRSPHIQELKERMPDLEIDPDDLETGQDLDPDLFHELLQMMGVVMQDVEVEGNILEVIDVENNVWEEDEGEGNFPEVIDVEDNVSEEDEGKDNDPEVIDVEDTVWEEDEGEDNVPEDVEDHVSDEDEYNVPEDIGVEDDSSEEDEGKFRK